MGDIEQTAAGIGEALTALVQELTSVWLAVQFGIILAAATAGGLIALMVRRRADPVSLTMGWPHYLRVQARLALENLGTIIFIVLVALAHAVMLSVTWPSRSYLLGVATSLAIAWVAIALVAGVIRNQFVYRLVAVFAWTIAALSILDLLQPTMAALDSLGLVLGGVRVTPLLVIKTTVLLLFTLWTANVASDFFERRVRSSADLTPSIQVLIGKLIRLMLITFAILVALSTVGIDLTALAFFSGAVGVGIGFGLQKIVSNLVSGIILLADKSIKPGDVISIGDQFGWVTNMGARYTSVDTRDGREILVPNEDFVTQQVVNWSYSNYKMMLKSNFGVGYGSDPHKVREIAVAAARTVGRVIEDPAPVCYFENFGDSALEFSLRYWIADPSNGIINVRAPVMLALWDAFKREGIEIPFPQRDLNLRAPVKVVVEDGGRAPRN